MNNESFAENNQQTEQPVTPIGPRLKNARESLRLTITDIARQLRLADERIESLENDNYQDMPGITFVKGYLRAYARLVDLPADEIIADFDRLNLMPDTKSFVLSSNKSPILLSNKSMRWIIYSVGIGLLILVATWWNSVTTNDPTNQNLTDVKHQPIKNTSPGSTSNAINTSAINPSKDTHSASPIEPEKNTIPGTGTINTAPAANATDTQHSQAATPAPETTPAANAAADAPSPETSKAEKNTANTTDEETDEPKPVKKPVARARSHYRPQFDEPFDDEYE